MTPYGAEASCWNYFGCYRTDTWCASFQSSSQITALSWKPAVVNNYDLLDLLFASHSWSWATRAPLCYGMNSIHIILSYLYGLVRPKLECASGVWDLYTTTQTVSYIIKLVKHRTVKCNNIIITGKQLYAMSIQPTPVQAMPQPPVVLETFKMGTRSVYIETQSWIDFLNTKVSYYKLHHLYYNSS